ncbi:MAG TPA: hypothetical protein VIL34_08600 [Actinopolymorphaceae bacterium]
MAIGRPVTIRLGGATGGGTLTIRKVLSNGIDFDLSLAGGGGGTGQLLFKGECGPVFWFSSYGGGSGTFCKGDGRALPAPKPRPGMVGLQVPGKTRSGSIVLRIVSG